MNRCCFRARCGLPVLSVLCQPQSGGIGDSQRDHPVYAVLMAVDLLPVQGLELELEPA